MRMMMKSLMAGAFVSLATVGVPGTANAVVCGTALTADTLTHVLALPGSFCTVEDKTFTFTSSSFSGGPFGLTNDSLGIAALASTGGLNTNPGIRFNAAF